MAAILFRPKCAKLDKIYNVCITGEWPSGPLQFQSTKPKRSDNI